MKARRDKKILDSIYRLLDSVDFLMKRPLKKAKGKARKRKRKR